MRSIDAYWLSVWDSWPLGSCSNIWQSYCYSVIVMHLHQIDSCTLTPLRRGFFLSVLTGSFGSFLDFRGAFRYRPEAEVRISRFLYFDLVWLAGSRSNRITASGSLHGALAFLDAQSPRSVVHRLHRCPQCQLIAPAPRAGQVAPRALVMTCQSSCVLGARWPKRSDWQYAPAHSY